MKRFAVDVCLSPLLFPAEEMDNEYLVVVIDVFRATTSMIAAFDNGVEKIIPVAGTDQALELKTRGCLVAGERDGTKLDFADFGNSPLELKNAHLKGQTLVFTTTNGTKAIELAKPAGMIALGAFSNLQALSIWLSQQEKRILILCAGWKNQFSLEDTLCAGALASEVIELGVAKADSDASSAAMDLWDHNKNRLAEVLENSEHARRLKALNQEKDIGYCLKLNSSTSIPRCFPGNKIEFKNLQSE